MNVLIVDTDKISIDLCHQICNYCIAETNDDWVAIPKGIDVLQDISVDWMRMIRDKMDEKIKEIEMTIQND